MEREKREGDWTCNSVAEHVLSMLEALGSIPLRQKRKKEKQKRKMSWRDGSVFKSPYYPSRGPKSCSSQELLRNLHLCVGNQHTDKHMHTKLIKINLFLKGGV